MLLIYQFQWQNVCIAVSAYAEVTMLKLAVDAIVSDCDV